MNDILKLARKTFERTEELSDDLMNALQEKEIEYYRAPYEADAQLSFFNRIQYIDAVATADADIIVFGANVVIFPPAAGMHSLDEPQLIFRRGNVKHDSPPFDCELAIKLRPLPHQMLLTMIHSHE